MFLVDRDAVKLLARYELNGIELEKGPRYMCTWINSVTAIGGGALDEELENTGNV